ncbi:hypothetical protein CEXT_386061, partial [Caerostris extrusa]
VEADEIWSDVTGVSCRINLNLLHIYHSSSG